MEEPVAASQRPTVHWAAWSTFLCVIGQTGPELLLWAGQTPALRGHGGDEDREGNAEDESE